MTLSYDVFHNDNQNAEWVVLIHGFGGNRKMWNRQLDALKERYHVLNFDLPGHGESEDMPRERDLLAAIVDSIYQAMETQGISAAHFMGVSLGTVLAILMAMRHQDAVIDMVLCGVIIGVNGYGTALMHAANAVHGILPYMWLYKLMAWVLMPRKQSSFSRRLFIQSAKRLGRKHFDFWLVALMAARKTFSICAEHIAQKPKLCVMGEHDDVFLKMLLRANREAYGFQIQTIANCGHLCNIEKAKEFNSIALSFLQNEQHVIQA